MIRSPVEKHFDKVATTYDSGKEKYSFYYSTIKRLLKEIIGTNKVVIEYGCGTGDLLASLNPKMGLGYDLSPEMIKVAKSKHKSKTNLYFSDTFLTHKSKFINLKSADVIFMTDVIEHLEDVEGTFTEIRKLMNTKTIFINTMANPLWEPLLILWEKMGWKMQEGPHKRISYKDIKILSDRLGLRIIKHDYKLLVPINIPFITNFANKYLENYLKPLCFIEYFVAVKR